MRTDDRRAAASALDRLARLHSKDLTGLHRGGTLPTLSDLDGVLEGRVLTGALNHPTLRPLRLWRGKAFDQSADGTVTGLNRLGAGPVEVSRFRFEARIAASLFSNRDVVVLDHDNDDNPELVRRFHDELICVGEGLFLATSHHRSDLGATPQLRFLCHFALAFPNP